MAFLSVVTRLTVTPRLYPHSADRMLFDIVVAEGLGPSSGIQRNFGNEYKKQAFCARKMNTK